MEDRTFLGESAERIELEVCAESFERPVMLRSY